MIQQGQGHRAAATPAGTAHEQHGPAARREEEDSMFTSVSLADDTGEKAWMVLRQFCGCKVVKNNPCYVYSNSRSLLIGEDLKKYSYKSQIKSSFLLYFKLLMDSQGFHGYIH